MVAAATPEQAAIELQQMTQVGRGGGGQPAGRQGGRRRELGRGGLLLGVPAAGAGGRGLQARAQRQGHQPARGGRRRVRGARREPRRAQRDGEGGPLLGGAQG